jgi:hypothetical protein
MGHADDVWSVPLKEKAAVFEKNILKNHWIDGLYPSIVEVPLDGGPVDQSTTGYSNIAHSVCWTANYLTGQAYRYAFTKDAKVRRHAGRVLQAMVRCMKITGVKGLQARGYVYGHGDSYEEREGSAKSEAWHQGVGRYSNLRWRGDPSHHNYSDSIHGYAAYYDLAADEKQKELIGKAVHDLVGYWAFNDGFIRKHDGSVSTHILGITDGRTPNLRTVMAAAGLKAAHHITGDDAFDDEYQKLVEQFGFRKWEEFPQRMRKRQGHDDAEHVFGHLDNLFRQETDPELLGFYRKVLAALWQNHKDDRQSLFSYIYVSLVPDCPDRDRALREALWTLRTWPTNRAFRPRMNSIRPDIEIVDGVASRPLPMYESPWDNEYQWKASLYKLDGWMSRQIVSLATPVEDPMVVFAADEGGDLYKSIDGGANWRQVAQSLGRKVNFVAGSRRISTLFAGCADGFYLSTTGGQRWSRLPVPREAGTPTSLFVDRTNENLIYAVGENGAYRSVDHGERWLGTRWESLTESLPPSDEHFFSVGGSPTRAYAMLDGTVYSSQGDGRWQEGGFAGIPEYGRPLPFLVMDPFNPGLLYTAVRVSYEGLALNIVFRSEDGGASWNNGLPRLYTKYVARYQSGWDFADDLRGELYGLTVASGPDMPLLAATSMGVMRSEDGGESWSPSNHGLRIPVARSVHVPPGSGSAYAGTPGGLYRSGDGGNTWHDSNLILTFRSNIPREVGAAGFVDAYWMARYHGFISEDQAGQDPTEWDMDI